MTPSVKPAPPGTPPDGQNAHRGRQRPGFGRDAQQNAESLVSGPGRVKQRENDVKDTKALEAPATATFNTFVAVLAVSLLCALCAI